MSDPDQSNPQTATAKPKMKPRYRILLGVSLALNLLVVGVVVGAISKGPRDRGGLPSSRSISTPYVAAFEGATKREMRSEMRARLENLKNANEADRADYAEFVVLVRAESFDAARALEIMAGQLARAGAVQEVGRSIAIEKLNAMNLEERKAYADRLEAALKRRDERRSKRREDRKDDRK